MAHTLTGMMASVILVITILLAYHLWSGSALPRSAFGWSFVTGSTWDPVAEKFGALPFIYGTVMTSFLALLIAVPADSPAKNTRSQGTNTWSKMTTPVD